MNSKTPVVPAPSRSSLSRRALAMGAAWSIPVVAAAASSPSAAASPNPAWDVSIVGTCSTLSFGTDSRQFTYTAITGTVPAHTQFTLTSSGLLSATLIDLPSDNIVSLSVLGDSSVSLTLNEDLPAGSSFSVGLGAGLINAEVITTFSSALVGADANASDNSDSFGVLLGVAIGGIIEINVCF